MLDKQTILGLGFVQVGDAYALYDADDNIAQVLVDFDPVFNDDSEPFLIDYDDEA